MSAFRKIVSFGHWLLDSEKSISDFRKETNWKEEDLIVEDPSDKLMSPLVITAHVFYSEFAAQLIDSLRQLPSETKVLVTTTSQQIKQDLESYLQVAGNPYDVRLTPNTGRNFGPLLVEFSEQLLSEDSFIHVHSKKSFHSPQIAEDWLKRKTDILLTRSGIQRISSLIEDNPKIGLVYVDASDLLWGINFRWGRSKKLAQKNLFGLPGFEKVNWKGRLAFPAGGMFWAKVDAVRPLLDFKWTYDAFPTETNQQDGELQHALERAIGPLSFSRGYFHGVYVWRLNRFTVLRKHSKKPHH